MVAGKMLVGVMVVGKMISWWNDQERKWTADKMPHEKRVGARMAVEKMVVDKMLIDKMS